ncbi:MAG: hypothetical protein IKX53_02450 [Bacteroidales bacterium]|nr:hypothetical protein [Bacteroidales bacterium]
MKRLLFVTGVLLVAALGCDREPCAECSDELAARHISLTLSGSALQTRALDVPSLAESNVVRCLLYVFSRTGTLVDTYDSADGRFDFFLTDEVYDFVVIANKNGLPRAAITKNDLLATATPLAENAVGNFVMVGALADHLIEADEKITVEVSRLVGKVTCTIRTAFTGALADKPFVVEEIGLINVAGQNTLALSDSLPDASARWYNRMGLEDPPTDGCPPELLAAHIDVRMSASDSLAPGHSFYPYPNSSPDSHDKDVWGSRCTRFVVKANLNGRTTWYPVTLERVRPNRHYHVDLTIAGYGVEHPEDPLTDYSAIAATVSVADWIDGGTLQGLY